MHNNIPAINELATWCPHMQFSKYGPVIHGCSGSFPAILAVFFDGRYTNGVSMRTLHASHGYSNRSDSPAGAVTTARERNPVTSTGFSTSFSFTTNATHVRWGPLKLNGS